MTAFRMLVELLRRGYASSLIWYALLLAAICVGVIIGLIVLGPIASQIYQDDYCLQCT